MPSEKWKDELSKTMLLFSRTLEPEEWEAWRGFLADLNPAAVEYAFDNWNRNGRFFPKPKDILTLVDVYKSDTSPRTTCGTACRMRHGKGYDQHDMLWLWKKVSALVSANRPVVYENLLAEIDSKREGGKPAWRR